jgi:hypothetical protein
MVNIKNETESVIKKIQNRFEQKMEAEDDYNTTDRQCNLHTAKQGTQLSD